MEKRIVVLNTLAGAADATLSNRKLKIKNCPEIDFLNIIEVSPGLLPSLVETASTASVAFTAANDTEYKFLIKQWDFVNQRMRYHYVFYKTDSSGSLAEIASGLSDTINALVAANQLNVTVSGASSPLVITGAAGNPVFTIDDVLNTTTTVGTTVAPHATPGTALAGTTTVTVTTAAAHGLVAGQSVSISGATGYTFTANGIATVGSIQNAVIASVPTSSTFTLYGVTGSGTNTGTIVISVVPQYARGTQADIIAKGAAVSDATGSAYSTFIVKYRSKAAATNAISNWVEEDITVFILESATNFSTWKTALLNHLQALSGGVSDPEALAVQG